METRIDKKYKKRNSAKKHSAKKHSVKKSSLKKSSLKKSSLKKSSLKKSSFKKESLKNKSLKKSKNGSEYNMKGMGILLNMYGGAITDLENDLEKLKSQLKKYIRKYKSETDLSKKKELKAIIKSMKQEVIEKTDKINNLLEGITDTTSRACIKTNNKIIKGGDIGEKIASFLKTTTGKVTEDISKTVGKTLSEGVKIGSKEASETVGKTVKTFSESTQDVSSKLKKLKIF